MKLNTLNLIDEIKKILEEDMISVGELANLTNVPVQTLNRILSHGSPTTQMSVGRRIAEGTNRKILFNETNFSFIKNEPNNSDLTETEKE